MDIACNLACQNGDSPPPSSSGWVGNKDRAMEDKWQQKLLTLLRAQPEPRPLAEADENDCNQ
eukprot:scaffold22100_cov29-Attheya_sp.AAC.1